jgi:chromate reductase, NAD(P)H dehydrogenase (quinone)
MTQTKILAFAGSTRRDSYNKKLARLAADAANAAGAEVTLLDLGELPMPLYDGDLEKAEGIPPNAMRFKELLLAHRGLLVASPEYNSSISGVLKNAIDWASRQAPGETPLACFQEKVCGLLAASPGALGGLRGLVTVRSILGNIGVIVVPDQIAVGKAHEAFDAEGRLVDAKQRATVERIAKRVVDLATRLAPQA